MLSKLMAVTWLLTSSPEAKNFNFDDVPLQGERTGPTMSEPNAPILTNAEIARLRTQVEERDRVVSQLRAGELPKGFSLLEYFQQLSELASASPPEVAKSLRKHEESQLLTFMHAKPNSPDMDQFLFELGGVHEGLGRIDEARKDFGELIKQHPSSSMVPHAWMQLAELDFLDAKFDQALPEYGRIADDSKLAPFAHYKRAWCEVNLSDFAKARAEFERTLKLLQANPSPQDAALLHAARTDWLFALAPEDHVDLIAEVKRVWGADARDGLVRLAGLEHDSGRAVQDVAVLRYLLTLPCTETEAVRMKFQILGEQERLLDRPEILATQKEIAESVGAGNTPGNDDHNQARKLAEGYLRLEVLSQFREALELNDPGVYEFSDSLAKLYLSHFAEVADAPQIRYDHAQALEHQRKLEQAKAEYDLVATTHADPEVRRAAVEASHKIAEQLAGRSKR
jgi:tetratricopeptide (TPR) repeat protein